MIFFTKDKIGAKVVLMPQYNAVSRAPSAGGAMEQAIEATITDIKRATLTIVTSKGGAEQKYSFNERGYPSLMNSANYGYRAFSDWDAFNTYRIASKVQRRLMEAVRGYGSDTAISDEQYRQIAQILGWDDLLG
jgi:hypothetical protein